MKPTIESLEKENLELRDSIAFIAKWVERGLYSHATSPKTALLSIAYDNSMPWHHNVWDVDHTEYRDEFYRDFPNAKPPAREVYKG